MFTNEFRNIIEMCQPTYIGMGNPSSKILILGKECAIDSTSNEAHYKAEVIDNAYNWLVNSSKEHVNVDNWFEVNELNPLHPYKGQKFKKSENGGTCSTWFYYQRLFNQIAQKEAGEYVDFFNNCFISELSDATAKNSTLVDNDARLKSIEKRKSLLKMPFFQQFPIVIAAVGHYCRDFNINLEEMFDVKWIGHTIDIGGKWINIHYNLEGAVPKLLIHTNQLSQVSNALLDKITEVCIEFINKNNIEL